MRASPRRASLPFATAHRAFQRTAAFAFVALGSAIPRVALTAQTEPAADSTRPHYRVTLGIGDVHWLRFGFERDIRPGWAVKGLVGAGPYTGLAAIGPAVRIPSGTRSDLGLYAAGGKMACSTFLDGGASVCERPNEDAGWGLGGGAYWLVRFREADQWSFGPEVAYWNRPATGEDPGFDVWTVGIAVHKRFRGR